MAPADKKQLDGAGDRTRTHNPIVGNQLPGEHYKFIRGCTALCRDTINTWEDANCCAGILSVLCRDRISAVGG